jgi:regulator of replication initiation timing
MEQEVRTWRHIGIAFAVSFFALTLTLLSFGSNVFRQTTDLANDTKAIRSNLQSSDTTAKQSQYEIEQLKARMAAIEKAAQAKQVETTTNNRKNKGS